MTLDEHGHAVLAGSRSVDPSDWFRKFSVSLYDPIPVGDAAAQTSALATLAALSPAVVPSVSSPVFFFRADANPREQFEVTTDGSTFQKYIAAETVVDTGAGGGSIGAAAASSTDPAQVTLSAGSWRIDVQTLLTLNPSAIRSIYLALYDGTSDLDTFRINAQTDWGIGHFMATGHITLASSKTIKIRYVASATGGTQAVGAERLVATRIAKASS